MSEEINNREYRKQAIVDLLAQLHAGKTVQQVKSRFEEVFGDVSAAEIADAERALIEGGLPVEEVQKLCDVHAAVFKGSIADLHKDQPERETAGHPAHTLKAENRALERLIAQEIEPFAAQLPQNADKNSQALARGLQKLKTIHIHYLRKETLIFPYMENHGITAPPQVMWGVDDEIRALIKEAAAIAQNGASNAPLLKAKTQEAILKIREMIFKEENILIPMLFDTLTQEEWRRIEQESGDLGYCLIPTPPAWNPPGTRSREVAREGAPGEIILPTGVLTTKELTALLDALPVDITFVDKEDTVKYFSQSSERIFPRAKAVIGRNVANCHPPASVHVVESIVADFKSGKKNHEDFWIQTGDRFVYIRYLAVRDAGGSYLGTLEVTQNIKPIQQITGEKRLIGDWAPITPQ